MGRKRHIIARACDLVSIPDFTIDTLESRLFLSVTPLIPSAYSPAVSPAQGMFADLDVGSPTPAGSLAFTNGVYTLSAGGSGFGASSDQFNFAYLATSENVNAIANVTSIANTNAGAGAGLMIRNDVNANSAFVAIVVTPSDGIELLSRPTDGGTTSQSTLVGFAAPKYLELSLSAGSVTAYYSNNNTSWSEFGSNPVTLGNSPLVGLAASSDNNSALTTATFSNVSILPAGLSDADVGAPALPGSAGYLLPGNQYLISGNGTGIGGSSDQLNFTSHSLTGGGSVIALVNSQSSTNASAAAGVMIRDSLSSNAIFASLLETPQNGIQFQWRTSLGAAASTTTVSGITGPIWLELTQQGNQITAYSSPDDVNWTQVGSSQTIVTTSATALAGLAVASGDDSTVNTATFSDVSINQGGWTDADVGSPSPGGSAIYDTPSATSTVFGSGSGIGGTSDQFNFDSTAMTGNGSILAYVNSISSAGSGAQAGIMLRTSDAANSPFVAVTVSSANGLVFEWRSTTGGNSVGTQETVGNGTLAPPIGLKLTRSGNSFTAYYSPDGVNWDVIGSGETVPLSPTALAGLAVTAGANGTPCTAAFSSVGIGASPPPGAGIYSTSDELFLDNLEQSEFNDFYDEANPTSGLVPDNNSASGGNDSSDSSIAADGFDLTALTIGDSRGYVSHSAAYQRTLTTINFLYNSGASMDGYFFHFLNPTTGANYGGSELSSVDTSELMAGVLSVAQYWAGTPLQTAALQLYDRVNRPFMQEHNGQFYGAYVPGSGFSGGYSDFSEGALLYLMALGSPTFPTAPSSWDSWTRTPVVNYSGYSFVTADDGALFTVQYPQAWFNLQGEIDNTGFNFYTNSQTATLAQRQMFINLNSTYSDYGANSWGLTASEGPSGYSVWGGPPTADLNGADGVIVPTAPGGSLEFTPRYSLSDLENLYQLYGSTIYRKYGFVDAFNPLTNWTSPLVLGIDVGMTLVSAENSRTDMVWNTFMGNTAAQQATAVAGFHAAADKANYVVTSTSDPTGGTGRLTLRQALADANASGGNETIDFAEGISGTINFSNTPPNVTCNLTIIGPTGVPLTINGTGLASVLTFNAGVTASLQNVNVTTDGIANSGNLTIAGNVTLPQITGTGKLTIGTSSSDATLQLTSNGGVSQQNSLTITPESTLDLRNNELLVNYGTGTDPLSTVVSYIDTAYDNGLWNGTGLTSTSVEAQTPGIYALGYADGADGIVSGISSGQIEILPTLTGDATLQGNVNFGDFQLLAAGFGSSGGWDEGNFTYASTIDFGDFQLLAANFGNNSSLSSVATGGGNSSLAVFAAAAATASNTSSSLSQDSDGSILVGDNDKRLLHRRRRII